MDGHLNAGPGKGVTSQQWVKPAGRGVWGWGEVLVLHLLICKRVFAWASALQPVSQASVVLVVKEPPMGSFTAAKNHKVHLILGGGWVGGCPSIRLLVHPLGW